MNWNEFLRTLVWFLSFLAVFGAITFGVFATEISYRRLKIAAAMLCVFIAIFGFSVIGGMNWGPAQ